MHNMRVAAQSLRLQAARRSIRNSRNASTQTLTETLHRIVPIKQDQLRRLRSQYGDRTIGEIKVENVIGGMRGLKSMLWEASVLDPAEGIRFHGHSIADCQKQLPTAPNGKEMLPESMLWLLLTGEIPSESQVRQLSSQLAENGTLPSEIEALLDSFPKTLHPMTQFAMGVAALNQYSKFSAAYERGIKKADYWPCALDDALDLIAKLPVVAARIFANVYHDGKSMPSLDKNMDLIGNYSNMLGLSDNHTLTDYLRLYIALHGDHEGGNVSAHTSHLVGSALSDPYLSYSAALLGLAGPLHGLANQEVLRWILEMQKKVGETPNPEQIEEYLWTTLKSGQVVPGYGHGVLRSPDPRFRAIQQFCQTRPELRDSPVVQLVQRISDIAPQVLTEHGKTKNPHPNVDAVSGCVLYHFGITQFKYYTVIFGVSRALGCATQYVWDRALGLPIERPKSLSLDALEAILQKN